MDDPGYGCAVIPSEDLDSDTGYDGIRALDPFDVGPS
jgi:hypothetical protein